MQTKRWHDRETMEHIILPINYKIVGPLVECIRIVRLTSQGGVKCSPNLLVLIIALIVSPTGRTGARRSAESEFAWEVRRSPVPVWCWTPSMSASTPRRGSSASQLLRATKDILQDVGFGTEYVWISGMRRVG